MPVEIQTKGEASEEALIEIERELGHELPADYRGWLKANNGGFIPDGATLRALPLYLTVLVGAMNERGASPLLRTRRITVEYLTDDYLPLNEVDAGLLALKLTEPDRGSVWYLGSDHMGREYDYRAAGYDSEQAYICAELLKRVADSFSGLLGALVPDEDEDEDSDDGSEE